MDLLKKFCKGLPIIKELRRLDGALQELQGLRYYLARQADSEREQLTLSLLSQDKFGVCSAEAQTPC